jgi:hypothetical protein
MEYRYAIQSKCNGQVIDYCNTQEQAEYWLKNHPVELVDTTKASKLSVTYTELGGPWGYGHQEESFITYGGLKRCIINLYNWMKSEASIWGPDVREVKDYFRHCSLYINNENKTQWLLNQIDKIDKSTLFA